MRPWRLGLLLLAAVNLFPSPAQASCGCVTVEEGRADFWARQSDAVFEASADSVEVTPHHTPEGTYETRATTLRVLKTHKGELDPFVVLRSGWRDCSYRFESGRRYLVYAERSTDGSVFVRSCHGTIPLEQAEPDLNDFARTGVVCGRVTGKDGRGTDGATIYVFRAGKEKNHWLKYSAKSRSDGNYRVGLVPAGKYQVVAVIDLGDPPLRAIAFPEARIPKSDMDSATEVFEGSESCGMDMIMREQPLQTVVGFVRTPEGDIAPAGAVRVTLEPHLREYPLHFRREAKIQPDGSFVIARVPQGRFVLRAFPVWGWEGEGQPRWSATAAWVIVKGDGVNEAAITLRPRRAKGGKP